MEKSQENKKIIMKIKKMKNKNNGVKLFKIQIITGASGSSGKKSNIHPYDVVVV